ncbi:hypothetical protein BDP27DRAFT_1313682 [Rhodocollybia butyracea]|uniref:JmjC domain-containing protein n=1 Tax=Rhodocollybia butyracea TaxID=206335 RepID=A0A9P5UDX6_9AGAR|nr:hypothetical protein BDP27DRAFT_1313682 [Rhodocollybia butyracea]
MSVGYHGQIPVRTLQIPKTNLSQILNPPAQIQAPGPHQVPQGHVHQHQQYRNLDYAQPQEQWNSRNDQELTSNRYEGYYTNGGEQWGTNISALSGDRDYPNQQAPRVALDQQHHHSMFLDSTQSPLQLQERASTRIQAAISTAQSLYPHGPANVHNDQGQPSRKRNASSEASGSSHPKKLKKTPSTVPPNRGYTKKKRTEDEALRIRNGYLASKVTYVSEKGKESSASDRMRMLKPAESSSSPFASLTPDLQTSRCMSAKYKTEDFPRCVSCVRRWAGDTCRFHGLRIFLKNEKKEIVGTSFVNNQKAEKPMIDFPNTWNVSLLDKDVLWTMRVTARHLLPILQQERKHVDTQQIIYRPREVDVRATCDTCMTSLFCCSWMCRLCGRESCADCYEEVVTLTSDPIADLKNADPTPELQSIIASRIAAQQARRERQNHSNPFFLSCTKREEHRAEEFTPVSRFCLKELDEAIKDMETVLKQEDEENQALDEHRESGSSASDSTGVRTPPDLTVTASGSKDIGYGHHYPELQSRNQQPYRPYHHQPYVSQLQTAHAPHFQPQIECPSLEQPSHQSQLHAYSYDAFSDPSPATQIQSASYHLPPQSQPNPTATPQSLYQPPSHLPDIPLHPIPTFSFDNLTPSTFQSMWREGIPMLVTDVGQRFRINWTPEYFMKTYGDRDCLIIECQSDANKRVTVGEFFAEFGKYESRETEGGAADNMCSKGEIWKLKDWPPSADFQTTFPELYDDFSQAVPIPNYVRRDGSLNIASHFPRNAVAPDLGPKMYNAMASKENIGSKGSTRLHMDMADALNVMTYAANCPDGSSGCAAWDLFRAEDSVKLRDYLKKKFPGALPTDPIHGQQVYLDPLMRRELAEECGVYSFRVYQRPGEAVFIPAGCAHQVCNLADCIKVAVDFVSPENVERCEQLTREFREQNQSKVWKEDILQLKSMMWFAWLSCSQQRDERKTRAEGAIGSE